MPESVLSPAPVRMAIRRPRSNSAASSTSASWVGLRGEPIDAAARAITLLSYDRLNNGVFGYVSDVKLVRLENLDSDEIRDYRDLTDVVLRRLSEPAGGLYIAESTKVIERALRAGHRPRSVLTIEKWLPEIEQLFADQDPELPVFVGDAELLQSLTGFNLHRGALASMHRPPLASVAATVAGATRIIVLEDIVDHTN